MGWSSPLYLITLVFPSAVLLISSPHISIANLSNSCVPSNRLLPVCLASKLDPPSPSLHVCRLICPNFEPYAFGVLDESWDPRDLPDPLDQPLTHLIPNPNFQSSLSWISSLSILCSTPSLSSSWLHRTNNCLPRWTIWQTSFAFFFLSFCSPCVRIINGLFAVPYVFLFYDSRREI